MEALQAWQRNRLTLLQSEQIRISEALIPGLHPPAWKSPISGWRVFCAPSLVEVLILVPYPTGCASLIKDVAAPIRVGGRMAEV